MTDVESGKLSEYTAIQYVMLTYPNSILVKPTKEHEISFEPSKDGYNLKMTDGEENEDICVIAYNNEQGKLVEIIEKEGMAIKAKTCYKKVQKADGNCYLERTTYDRNRQAMATKYYTCPPEFDLFMSDGPRELRETIKEILFPGEGEYEAQGGQKTKIKATP